MGDVPRRRGGRTLDELGLERVSLIGGSSGSCKLVLSPHTVHRHVANIRRKLGRNSRTAAVAEAARLGIL